MHLQRCSNVFAELQAHAAAGALSVAPALRAAAVPTSASRAKSALRSERILPAIVDRDDSFSVG